MENTDSIKAGFTTTKRWLENRNVGKYFPAYIRSHSWENIVIYGAGELGQILYNEIKDEICVLYFIDRSAETIVSVDGIPVILPQHIYRNEPCDIIINTVMSGSEEIIKIILEQRPEQAIISLRDAVYEF